MKDKIIEKQDEIIANLKEVGQLYFRIKDKATKQDVARMTSLTTKGMTLESELIILKAQDISVETTINQEVEKRIKEIDQHGRIAASVIKKKLWSMRFNEEDVKKETDGRRKRFIYGYTEAINDISQWLTEMVDICRCSRLTCSEKPNNSQKTEGGEG